MDETPMRVVTRERQEHAEMERQYNELNERAEELWDLMERKRTRPVPPLPVIRYAATQREAEALVEEAVADWPPLLGLTMRANAVRLLASMYHVHGSTRFPRGWVRPAMQAFIAAGVDCPNARCWRSYRSDVQDNPGGFLSTKGTPTDLLRQMELDLLGE